MRDMHPPATNIQCRACDAHQLSFAPAGVPLPVTNTQGLETLPKGDRRLRLWLEDAAGNHDPERASDPLGLRFDDEAPVAVFEPTDPRDPLTVIVCAD